MLLQVGAGVAMTLVTQSSSAAMAITLTAAQGGLIGTSSAAAVVIGANVGTTATALLATIGATPNARRAAWAHVAFNVITAAVALALLPWLVDAIGDLRGALELPPDPATQLALFHTVFNLLGVLLMWPLANPLARWLGRRFRAAEEDAARPQHLDDTVLAVPTLALDALEREIGRLGGFARTTLAAALDGAPAADVARHRAVVVQLDAVVERFAERLTRSAMQPGSAQRIARALRVERYHETCAEAAEQAGRLRARPDAAPAADAAFGEQARALLAACAAEPGADPAHLDTALTELETRYQSLKAALLDAGASGQVSMGEMEAALRRASALRRALEQAAKGARLAGTMRHASRTA